MVCNDVILVKVKYMKLFVYCIHFMFKLGYLLEQAEKKIASKVNIY